MARLAQLWLSGGQVIQYDESKQYDVVFSDGRFLKDVLEDLATAHEEQGHIAKITVMLTISDGDEGAKDGRRVGSAPHTR